MPSGASGSCSYDGLVAQYPSYGPVVVGVVLEDVVPLLPAPGPDVRPVSFAWPRISPAWFLAVCTLTYARPCFNASAASFEICTLLL